MQKPEETLNKIYAFFFSYFRSRRMEKFAALLEPSHGTTILDAEGTAYNWEIFDLQADITLLNINIPDQKAEGFVYVKGDGRKLEYEDEQFQIVFSNSVIEHLGTFEDQILFAQEIRRVGKKIWVQTPARSFFFEPHWLAPFIHWFPTRIQRRLARNFTLRGLISRPSLEYIDDFLAELRLLTFKEMQQLFPDCEILVERFLGMPKAYIACG